MQLPGKAGRSSEDLICTVLTKKGQDVVVGSSPVQMIAFVYFGLSRWEKSFSRLIHGWLNSF